MFIDSAELYDLIYSFKDYGAEAAKVHKLINDHSRARVRSMLDVACGTGQHIEFFKRLYEVEGLDLDQAMLDIAKARYPDLAFHVGSMIDFQLEKRYGAIVCLFSAIGYVETKSNLEHTIRTMGNHLVPGGVLLVEPWLTPDGYTPGTPHAVFAQTEDLKVCRMNVSRVENGVSILDFHYQVATRDGIKNFTERHRLGLFTQEDYMQAFRKAGLKVSYDVAGLNGRGLFIGVQA